MLFPIIASATLNVWPFFVLLICVAVVIVSISMLRLHPFLALIMAAFLAGVIADELPADPKAPEKGQLVRAVELTIDGFGKTAGGVAIIIGMATIIGMCLMESGAADKVVRRFLAVCGNKPAGVSFAIVFSTYLLSIPIFFDSMFMLMIPIAVAMALRTGKDFTLYVLAICAGGTITHALTIPHPGPIYMAENLGIDPGLSIWVGIVVGAVPVFASWIFIQFVNKWTPLPLREQASAPLADAKSMIEKPESELPSFMASLLPIILPIILISCASVFEVIKTTEDRAIKDAVTAAATVGVATPTEQVVPIENWASALIQSMGGRESFMKIKDFVDFIGNKNIALILGAALAVMLLRKQRKLSMSKIGPMMGSPLETGGVIILITAAGGAFGYMLGQAGVGTSLAMWAGSQDGINLVLLSFLVSMVFRIGQGSATVAMQTASAMFIPLLPELPCHPMYVFLAIGFGATGFSWMNDSGFWVVSRLSGFTEKETFHTWSLNGTFIALFGLLLTWVFSKVLPFAG